MEDFEFHIVVGEGMGARTMKLSVNPFTLVGATTRSGLLSSPLRDRFGQHYHLDFYDRAELTEIVRRSAALLKVAIDEAGAQELASRSRGTPRIANRLLRRVRDFAQVNEAPLVTREIALAALDLLEIDTAGFDKMDRSILGAIIDKFDGGPSARNPTQSRKCTNRTCCRRDLSHAPRADESRPSARIRISGAPVAARCSDENS